MSDLVGNPEDRFSCVEAHISSMFILFDLNNRNERCNNFAVNSLLSS